MSNIFVKLDDTGTSYICTWDGKEKVLQISSNGKLVKKYKELDFGAALHKIDKFQRRLQRRVED